MARRYELTIIVNTQALDNAVEDIIARFDRLVSEGGGRSVEVTRLGSRKLAYEIGKQQRADYTFIRFEASTDLLSEIDRMFKLDESVLRHMVVLDESPVPEETVEADEDEDEGGQDKEENDEDEDEGGQDKEENDEKGDKNEEDA